MLRQLLKPRISAAIDAAKKDLEDLDEPIIQALKQGASDQHTTLQNWLRSYKALRVSDSAAKEACARIIELMADHTALHEVDIHSCLEPVVGFHGQIEKCAVAAIGKHDKRKRKTATSLASKALWCWYPAQTPIYDLYARMALRVLCQLANLRCEGNDSKYAVFARRWCEVYVSIEGDIEELSLKAQYPYPPRIFDKLLWKLCSQR